MLAKQESGLVNKVAIQLPLATAAPVSFGANFEIYTNGTKRIFTDGKYHNLSPDVFIEASAPNIVQVRKPGVTWTNFFETLPMSLTKDCLVTGTKQTFCTDATGELKFYLNDNEDKDALDRQINESDRLLVKYRSSSGP